MSDHRAVRRHRPTTRRVVRTALLAALVVLLGLLAGATAAPPAAAQDDAQDDGTVPAGGTHSPVDLEVTGVEAVVTQPGDEIVVTAEIRHGGEEDLRELSVELAAHDALASRGALQRALDASPDSGSQELGAIVGTARRSAADVPAQSRRFVSVRTSLDELQLDASTSTVHPLSLSLVGDAGDAVGESDPGELARAVTALIITPVEIDVPVTTSVLVRLLGLDPSAGEGDEDVEWVVPVAQALTAAQAPVSVAADPLLARTVAGAAVGELLAGDEASRVAVPFASADLVGLVSADLIALARSHVELGLAPWPVDPASPPSQGAGAVDLVVAPAAPLRAPIAAQLLAGRTPAVVVAPEAVQLDPDGERVTSPGPLRPLADVAGLQALIGDQWLSRALASRPELGEADVQRVLAETALLWLERPGAPDRRGLLLDPGADWRPSPEGLAELLHALDEAPWLELTAASQLLDVEPSPSAQLTVPADGPPALSAAYLAALADAWTLVDAAADILTSPDPQEAGTPPGAPDADDEVVADGTTAGLRLDLLRAASVAFRSDEAAGRALIARAQESAASLIAGVEVVSQPTITLTDETGRLPVVLRNEATSALRVRVALGSRRLTFPVPAREVTLAPQTTTTVVFDARARTPGGTSPVDVTVTDPSGERELATGAMVVRIASYPVSALVVLAAVALLLLGTWLRGRLRRRRSDRPPVPGRTEAPSRASSAEHR